MDCLREDSGKTKQTGVNGPMIVFAQGNKLHLSVVALHKEREGSSSFNVSNSILAGLRVGNENHTTRPPTSKVSVSSDGEGLPRYAGKDDSAHEPTEKDLATVRIRTKLTARR